MKSELSFEAFEMGCAVSRSLSLPLGQVIVLAAGCWRRMLRLLEHESKQRMLMPSGKRRHPRVSLLAVEGLAPLAIQEAVTEIESRDVGEFLALSDLITSAGGASIRCSKCGAENRQGVPVEAVLEFQRACPGALCVIGIDGGAEGAASDIRESGVRRFVIGGRIEKLEGRRPNDAVPILGSFRSGTRETVNDLLSFAFSRADELLLFAVENSVVVERQAVGTAGSCVRCRRALSKTDAQSFGGKTLSELRSLRIAEVVRHVANPRFISAAEILSFVGLSGLVVEAKLETLSTGERFFLRLARLLLDLPAETILVFEDPFEVLDEPGARCFLGACEKLREAGNTVFIVSEPHPTLAICRKQCFLRAEQEGELKSGNAEAPTPSPIFSPKSGTDSTFSLPTSKLPSGRELPALTLPIGRVSQITGPIGSGKSYLLREVLVPTWEREKGPASYVALGVAAQARSVAEALEVAKPIAEIFAREKRARELGISAAAFVPHSKLGSCTECSGRGYVTDFDKTLERCGRCLGSGFERNILEVRVGDRTIAEVLSLPVARAYQALGKYPEIVERLRPFSADRETRLGDEEPPLHMTRFARLARISRSRRARSVLFALDDALFGLGGYSSAAMSLLESLAERGGTVVISNRSERQPPGTANGRLGLSEVFSLY